MFQNILVDKNVYSDFISRHDAVKLLKSRATQVYNVLTNGVGNQTSESRNGIYTVNFPLANGKDASMTGVCLDKLTHDFPMYKLNGHVINRMTSPYRIYKMVSKRLPVTQGSSHPY